MVTTGIQKNLEFFRNITGLRGAKKTKTSGCFDITDPRFNLVAYTQPEYLIQFARNKSNQTDGFFQRFLISVPDEVFIKRAEQKEALEKLNNVIDMKCILKSIYDVCSAKPMGLKLTAGAEKLYDQYHMIVL